jgi:hypothetical protein
MSKTSFDIKEKKSPNFCAGNFLLVLDFKKLFPRKKNRNRGYEKDGCYSSSSLMESSKKGTAKLGCPYPSVHVKRPARNF